MSAKRIYSFALTLCLIVFGSSATASASRILTWFYLPDSLNQQRFWMQLDASAWVEVDHTDAHCEFRVTNQSAMVEGNSGVIARKCTNDLLVFIPDHNANGTNPHWLRWADPAHPDNWQYLGQYNESLGIQMAWTYTFDPPGHQKRVFTYLNHPNLGGCIYQYVESYEDGRKTYFCGYSNGHYVKNAAGIAIGGVVIHNEANDILIFIPETKFGQPPGSQATDEDLHTLYFQHPGEKDWNVLGLFTLLPREAVYK